jgi:chromate transporter
MERELVRKRKLLSLDEFLHGLGLGQLLGSFAINVSVFVGYRLYGVVGGVLSAGAFALPAVALVIGLSDLYFRYHSIPALAGAVSGLGPVVIALIVDAGWSIGSRIVRSKLAIAIAVASLAAGVFRVNAFWILFCAGTVGILTTRDSGERSKERAATAGNFCLLAAPIAGATSALGSIGLTFLKVGFMFFGGGFVLIPMLHHRLVAELHWLTAREFIDGVAISNLTPGPLAVLATFAGYRMAGISGALIATVALLAPALALMLILGKEYERFQNDSRVQRFLAGVSPAVAGLILSAAVVLGADALTSWQRWLFAAACLLTMRKLHWPPVILLGIGAIGGYAGLLR